ncbi:putative ATP-dependent helicase IRC20 [Grifola frondosa]|uniref:Putative ATP-dependent helicase IRC20 n=1 Tax=Grifola frondosa TaxID=5627 RepID=A0A1C7MCY7_GRIFR|nr:putative ATP-dependent helicase IRC20 [Grifola frondosa]
MSSTKSDKQERNPRGIPKAPFIADVAEYLGPNPDVETALKEFQAALAYACFLLDVLRANAATSSKYRYMDHNLAQRRRGLEEKIPDIKKTLTMVEYLHERREGKGKTAEDEDDLVDDDIGDGDIGGKRLKTTFELNDTLYAEAELEDTDTVYLWLGANVMLSYRLPAAVALLRSKLEAAKGSLSSVVEDLEFLREQITVMEVNTARVYNWDVKRRRDKREKEAKDGSCDSVKHSLVRMRLEFSSHLRSLRRNPCDQTRPELNVALLLKIIIPDSGPSLRDVSSNLIKGTKRASTFNEASDGPRKRTKTSSDTFQAMDGDANLQQLSRSIPVYRHTLEIRYTTGGMRGLNANARVTEHQAKGYGWIEEENRLIQWLIEHAPNGDKPKSYDLGDVELDSAMGLLVVNSLLPSSTISEPSILLSLPPVHGHFNVRELDIPTRHGSLKDPLQACYTLQIAGRANMSARLQLVVLPRSSPCSDGEFPFSLRVEVDVALVSPAIFDPILRPRKGNAAKTTATHLEEAQRRVLLEVFPPAVPLPESYHGATDIPLLFSVLGPAPRLSSDAADQSLQPEALLPTLLPFQRRSVGWMLGREGKMISDSGVVVSKPDTYVSSELGELPLFWDSIQIGEAETWYVNRLQGVLSRTRPSADDNQNEDTHGGILAEEPGLGKTLECITLIMLNPSIGRNPKNMRWDPNARVNVKEIKTTLIVTPSSLAPQWTDELANHAPSLKVLIYDGWTTVPVPITEGGVVSERLQRGKSKRMDGAVTPMDVDEEVLDWCAYVNRFDVCITTYNVLQQDLGVARPPPDRPRRSFVQYRNVEHQRSPLVMCEWYRVIMDEVQMAGGGKTEEMVSLIPRLSSFAVSGTPARAQVADLIHVLKFLRINAVLQTPRAWTRLLLPAYVHEFISLFRRYTVRTMKTAVKDELTIPRQTRYVVPIELGKVERHVYDQNFENALLELGLDARGIAATENWEADTSVLRSWLRKLRGICTHPQVGQLMAHANKLHKPGVLKTIGEVLEGMKDQNWRNLMEDWRNKVQTMTTLAQLEQRKEDDYNRYRNALEILLAAEKEADNLISAVNIAIAEHAKRGDMLKAEAAKLKESRREGTCGEAADPETFLGKGKAPARVSETPFNEDFDLDEEGLPKTPVGEAYTARKRALQQRLRECRISLHKVYFMKGDVYHVLGADAEHEAYALAEDLRQLLLKSERTTHALKRFANGRSSLAGTQDSAERAMTFLANDRVVKSLQEEDLYVEVPYCGAGGKLSAKLMEEANELIGGLLNQQTALVWKWRTRLIALLTQPLSSGGEADGQEYTRSLDTQGEVETYLQAYSALLADCRETLTAERTLLAAHDAKEAKSRRTKAAHKANTGFFGGETVELDPMDSVEFMPVHEVLEKELADERKALLGNFDPGRAIKSVMVDLNSIAVRINREDDPEKIAAKDGATQLRALIADQGKLMDKLLQNDLTHLRKAFNERVLYFRQLQEISDDVVEANWEGDLITAIGAVQAERARLDTKINAGRARQRYMDHLAKLQEDDEVDEDDKACILCKCEFNRGFITPCAHVFCEACMKIWLARKEGKVCPVCRVAINSDQLQRFSIDQKPEDEQSVNKLNNEPVPKSRREIQYNVIDPKTFEEIQTVESLGSYGSKIQTLVCHLLHLSLSDPGSKSIIFSAWADSLHIIEHALRRNGISCLRIDQNRSKQNAAKRFRTDPSISVLLLHGERENAGLNVTCASRVFLVESVVHHAFEVQAIARIDRMGQTRPTEVYCYYAEGTVERNILDLAARQGQSLYTRDNSAGTLNATAFAMNTDKSKVDAPTKKVQKGDFVYKTDDMLAIFFPHLFEDIEYLLAPEDIGLQTSDLALSPSPSPDRQPRNAVAGPSRLR